MPNAKGSQVLLDWATISYRSIMRVAILVVLVLALGGLFWYLKASLHGTPEEMARLDIGRAERLLREAGAAAGKEPSRAASVGRADHLLSEARAAYDKAAKRAAKAETKLGKARKKAASKQKAKPAPVKEVAEKSATKSKVAAPPKSQARKKKKAAKPRTKVAAAPAADESTAAEDSFVLGEPGVELH